MKITSQREREREREREKLQSLHKELKSLRLENDKLAKIKESNSKTKLKASKFRALVIIKKALNNVELEKNKVILKNRDYEKEINSADSTEEVEAIREEVLLRIMEKFPPRVTTGKTKSNYYSSSRPVQQNDYKILEKLVQEISKMNDNNAKIKILEEQLTQMREKNVNVSLEKQLDNSQQNSSQIEGIKKELQILKESEKISWSIKSPWFILFIIVSFITIIGGAICGILIHKKKKIQEIKRVVKK